LNPHVFCVNTRPPFFPECKNAKSESDASKRYEGIDCEYRSNIGIGRSALHRGLLALQKDPLANADSQHSICEPCATRSASIQLQLGWMAPSDGRRPAIQREVSQCGNEKLVGLRLAAEQPFGRLLAPREVAKAVTFLASSEILE